MIVRYYFIRWFYRYSLLILLGVQSGWVHADDDFRIWVSSENNLDNNAGDGAMFVFDGEPPHNLLARIDPEQKKSHHPWISPDDRYALGTNRVSNSVTMYDVNALTVQATISLGPNPTHVQWGRLDGQYRFAFVGITSGVAAGGGYVSVIDLVDQMEVAQIPEDVAARQNGTHDADVTPDGRYVYFGNVGSNTVFKIAINAERGFPLEQTLEVGMSASAADVHVQGVRILPSGEKMYVSNEEGSVSVVELNYEEADEVLTTIDVTGGADDTGVHNSRISPDGRWVYVGSRNTGIVNVIDTETDTLVANIEAGMGANTPEFSPDGKYNLVPNQATDFVSIIDVETHRKIADIMTGQGPHNARFSPDGDFAFVTCKDDNVVSVIDMRNLTLLHNLEVDANPNGIEIQRVDEDGQGINGVDGLALLVSGAQVESTETKNKPIAEPSVVKGSGLGGITVLLLLGSWLLGRYRLLGIKAEACSSR